ncbi:MAG: UvrD-helicase domain-containing protein [Bacteroidota bacterium]|nr:UvrD-helicase domain-containing protein [Bacteroidota bacterium]
MYLKDLNKQQLEAVQHIDGASMIIAGAGSGKTRVLTYRIIHLLHNGILPHNILALTFTNKAAKEMKNRINQMITPPVKSLWMGTFHSIFSRILRTEAEKIGYSNNFTIYDQEDSKNMIKNIIKELNLDTDIYKPGAIQKRISMLKNSFINADNYITRNDLIEQDNIKKQSEFSRIFKYYQRRCKQSSCMDFDDLLVETCSLFNSFPNILKKYQMRFRYILIDEYQDTNRVQYLIIKQLAALNQNICVVGDDSQSIYSFRGANIQNILEFKIDYPKYQIYKLEQNYRSTSNIVNTANHVIKHNKKQIQKTIWTENKEGEPIIVCKTNSDREEGKIVANTIFELQMTKQVHHRDFAILYRTNAQSRALEANLRQKNMPYKIYGGISFYRRKEIKDILAYFRLCVNPHDEEAFRRIVNYPKRGIGTSTIKKISEYAINNNSSIWETINNLKISQININQGTINKLNNFVELITDFKLFSKRNNAYTTGEYIIRKSGIFTTLHNEKTPEGLSRFENIQELLNGLKEFTDNELDETDFLDNFMQDVALLTDEDSAGNDNKISLMTLHAAKGLEFPYVFIVGLEENLFPSTMRLEKQEDLEEERRLFYVGITRAEKQLFLSFTSNRFKWGEFIKCEPSRFLNELDPQYIRNEEIKLDNSEYFNNSYKKDQSRKIKYIKKYTDSKSSRKTTISLTQIERIKKGVKVKHERFGIGEVLSTEDENINKKAIVLFENKDQRKLLLRFAKVQII